MSPEILDDFTQPVKTNYAAKSFRQLLITLILFTPLFIFVALRQYFNGITYLGSIVGTIAFLGFGFSIVGFWNGCMSFYQMESSYIKYVGALGNFVFVAFLLLVLYFNWYLLNS